MSGYTGKILFVKTVASEYSWAIGRIDVHLDDENTRKWLKGSTEYAIVAESEAVTVEYADTRQQEIEGLQKKIEQERAESQHKINLMLGKIQELQAISHD